MTTLQQGTKAPAFSTKDQDGNIVSLSDFKGKKLVLYFYPKDDTPTCTEQACNLRDNIGQMKQKGIAVLGVSTDNEKSHKKFENKFSLPFPLLADEEQKMVNDYGVWGEKQMFGKKYMGTHRVTFLINEQGLIDHIIDKVEAKNHTQQILELWEIA